MVTHSSHAKYLTIIIIYNSYKYKSNPHLGRILFRFSYIMAMSYTLTVCI